MNQTYQRIPVYTGDVSGVASALYELGGMVVIHDPSGCNSTYNTHDETRWYDKESLIFISGLSERDAILGNDRKLIRDVVEAAAELQPAFIALTNSPIPFMNGTDFAAIARVVEKQTGIPAFYVPANGMHDYTAGAGAAFAALARFMDKEKRMPSGNTAQEIGVNILGVTPLDFDAEGAVKEMEELLTAQGFSIVANLGMGDYAKCWQAAADADVNLVVSASGLPLAKELQRRCRIPYVAGIPGGAFAKVLVEALKQAALTGENVDALRMAFDRAARAKNINCVLIGEAVTMQSVAAALALENKIRVSVICPLESGQEFLTDADMHTEGEEDLTEILANRAEDLIVVADPLYEPVLPEHARFVPLSHEAFSGRCFAKRRIGTTGDPSEAVTYISQRIL